MIVSAGMLDQSELQVKRLKEEIEVLYASQKASARNGSGERGLSSQRCDQLKPTSTLRLNGHTEHDSQGTHSGKQYSSQNSTKGALLNSGSYLTSQVVCDSSPSDVDQETEAHNSNTERNTSMASEHGSVNSQSPDIAPLQSVHSEEFRSEILSENRLQSRRAVTSSNASSAEMVEVPAGATATEPRDMDRYESFPSLAVRNLEAAVTELAGRDEISALTTHLTKTITQLVKIDRENNAKTVLSKTLMSENAEMKTQIRRVKEEYDELLSRQMEEIDALKKSLRRLYEDKEKQEYEIVDKAQVEQAMKTSSSSPETKHSKAEDVMLTAPPKSSDIDFDKLKKRITELEKQNKEIIHVNQQWDTHYQGMKTNLETHIRDLQRQNQEKDIEITRLRSGQSLSFDDKRQKDVDRMLIDARKRVEVEESARESAMHDLQLEKQRAETLLQRVGVLERQVTQLLKLKTGMEKEIKRLNQALVEIPPQPRTRQSEGNPMNANDMRSHIEALEAQVLTYKEDFESERRDRERLASEMDELKTQKENAQEERDTYSQQARWYEEDFRREQEEKERLQRMLRSRVRDDDYQYNIPPPPPPPPAEKERYVRRQAEYNYERDPYYRYGQYRREQQTNQPPAYSAQDLQQMRFNQTLRQGTLLHRGQPGYRDHRPDGYPHPGQNLARNDLEIDGVDDIDDEGQIEVDVGRNLKCPRCEREFLEEDQLELHVERCVH
ncbi:uncharacterized protein LOC144451933 isoform X2 [Glandiceps talaboti]